MYLWHLVEGSEVIIEEGRVRGRSRYGYVKKYISTFGYFNWQLHELIFILHSRQTLSSWKRIPQYKGKLILNSVTGKASSILLCVSMVYTSFIWGLCFSHTFIPCFWFLLAPCHDIAPLVIPTSFFSKAHLVSFPFLSFSCKRRVIFLRYSPCQ